MIEQLAVTTIDKDRIEQRSSARPFFNALDNPDNEYSTDLGCKSR